MLLLRQLEACGFRSMADPIVLPIRAQMTVLTGENDGGKTGTLHALEALLGERTLDADDICRSSGGPVEVVGVFSEHDDTDGSTEVKVRALLENGAAPRREVLRRSHAVFGSDVAAHTLPALKGLMDQAGVALPGGQAKPPYVEAAEKWLETRPEDEFTQDWVPLDRDLAARLPGLTPYRSSATADPENHVRTLVTQEVRRLLSEGTFTDRLGAVQADLSSQVEPSLEDLRTKILEYCPDVESVQVQAEYDFTKPAIVLRLVLVKNGEEHVLAKSGEGKKRRITLAIHDAGLEFLRAGENERAEIVTYDEPDTHLDYASQRALFGILDEQSRLENVQVVVATHSLNFIDKVPLQAIAHYRLNEEQHTQLEVLTSEEFGDETDFLASVCAGLGLRNSVLLDERVFLMLEGETEEAAMPGLFRTTTNQSLVSSGVTMFNSQGSGALRKIARALVKDWGRQIVVLLDEDQRVESAAWIADMGLAEGVDLFFVGTKELEDAFSDDQWAAVLNASFPPDDGTAWDPNDIAALRADAKFSRALVATARARCKNAGVGKPDLGLALASAIDDSGAIPQAIIDCIRCVEARAS